MRQKVFYWSKCSVTAKIVQYINDKEQSKTSYYRIVKYSSTKLTCWVTRAADWQSCWCKGRHNCAPDWYNNKKAGEVGGSINDSYYACVDACSWSNISASIAVKNGIFVRREW